MNRLILVVFLSLSIIQIQSSSANSDWKFDPKLTLNKHKNFSEIIKTRDYNSALKSHKKIAGSLLGISIDFTVGYNSTSANADATSSLQPVTTTNKSGFAFGALLNVNLFGFGFSTGLDFSKKNFGIQIPYYDSTASLDSVATNLNNSYLNIPINLYFDTKLSDKVGVSFTGGPYIGILLNQQNALSGFKDFDFGLNGIITGRYFLNPFMAILLGVQGQLGGLNNLISSSSVSKLHTVNWGLFTGLSVGI